MAFPVHYPNKMRSVMVILIFYCALLLHTKPVLSGLANTGGNFKQQVLGSRPPSCVDKCFSCRPCMATLVMPPHQKSPATKLKEESETYYLLSWKCRCGSKLFQP
ncbi:hypothetical protein AAC387_Pa03g3471 [Persea americana]